MRCFNSKIGHPLHAYFTNNYIQVIPHHVSPDLVSVTFGYFQIKSSLKRDENSSTIDFFEKYVICANLKGVGKFHKCFFLCHILCMLLYGSE